MTFSTYDVLRFFRDLHLYCSGFLNFCELIHLTWIHLLGMFFFWLPKARVPRRGLPGLRPARCLEIFARRESAEGVEDYEDLKQVPSSLAWT